LAGRVVFGFTISEVYACRLDWEALRLIEEFAAMVRWWAEKGRSFEGGPYEKPVPLKTTVAPSTGLLPASLM